MSYSTGFAFTSLEAALEAIGKPEIHTIVIGEPERQLILLALAELSIKHNGWTDALNSIALKMDNNKDGQAEMFENFRQNHTEALRAKLTKDV